MNDNISGYIDHNNEKKLPLVSIIIRTIGRPEVLREALESIRTQMYKNIEVIVIEDGQNISHQMITRNYSDMPINYYSTQTQLGRSIAGNLGLSRARGKYINFLDDDDAFLPEHVETLVDVLEINPNCSAAFARAYEVPTLVESTNPHKYREKSYRLAPFQPYNRLLLMYINYIPIQTIMFRSEIYENCGGFDENLEFLEDWDLWMRYASRHQFVSIDKITSKYRVPWKKSDLKERSKQFKTADSQIREKQKNLKLFVTAEESFKDVDNIITCYLKNNFFIARQIMMSNICRILRLKKK